MRDAIGTHRTTISSDDTKDIIVTYHSTQVVRFNDERITLNSGGYRTSTTKSRMNQTSLQFDLGYHVYQRDWDWYIALPNGQVLDFEDGIIIPR